LQSAQTIDRNGRKSFPRGGRVAGGVHLIGDWRARGLLVIAEGYATAATIHELTGHAVAFAFNAGNLEPAARAFRESHPGLPILVAGDNDHRKAREHLPDGRRKAKAGQEAAEKAANAVGGLALLPRFGEGDRAPTGTTWPQKEARHFLNNGVRRCKTPKSVLNCGKALAESDSNSGTIQCGQILLTQ
jgi:phage/plasmid primase-like uncharacterized protein